mgnify:CR=1 FL=1
MKIGVMGAGAVGCFYGTGAELVSKALADSGLSGREYARVVAYVNAILKKGTPQ